MTQSSRSVMTVFLTWVTRSRWRQRLQTVVEDRQQRTGNDVVSVLEDSVLEEWMMTPSDLTRLYILRRSRTRGRTVRAAFDEQCPSNHLQNRPRYRPVDDRQRTVRDRLIEGCRLQTARTGLSGCRAGRTTLTPRRGYRGDVLGWMWKLFHGMTVLWRCMLLASSTHLQVDLTLKHIHRLSANTNSHSVCSQKRCLSEKIFICLI